MNAAGRKPWTRGKTAALLMIAIGLTVPVAIAADDEIRPRLPDGCDVLYAP